MNLRGVGWKALLASGLLIVMTLGSAFWLITVDQQRRYDEHLTRQLLTAARMVRAALLENWEAFDPGRVAGLVHTLHADGAAVVIVSTDGRTLVDTTGIPGLAGSVLEQPEARQALLFGWGEATRRLGAEPNESRIVAVRVGSDASTLGIVWLARPAWTLGTAWHSLGKLSAAIGTVALLSTLTLAVVLTILRTRLLHRLTETARSLSAGDLSAKAEIAGSDEYAALSAALDQMRQRLARQVETIDRQRLTLQGLVDRLHEGVVLVDAAGRVALINPAAIRWLHPTDGEGNNPSNMLGQPLERVVPHHGLQRLLRGAPAEAAHDRNGSPAGSEAEPTTAGQEIRIALPGPGGEVQLLARVSEVSLPGDNPSSGLSSKGRMLVLTDITELTRVLRIKTDFVANASHELRTPLTALRAALETLLSMDLTRQAEEARRFLAAVDRQSRRLEAMVKDLLDLSRLESPTARFEPQTLHLAREFADLQDRFAERLGAKRITWEAAIPDGSKGTLVAPPHLVRLILDNLVDNAIKFTEPGGHVRVVGLVKADGATLQVIDDGCGIPEAEQERVFERFYQVERSRSGPERGTGLGLAIVRHAAAAMHGTVSLQSRPGEGTCVTVRIPQPPPSTIQGRPNAAKSRN